MRGTYCGLGYLTLSSYITAHRVKVTFEDMGCTGYLYQHLVEGPLGMTFVSIPRVCLTCNDIESFQIW